MSSIPGMVFNGVLSTLMYPVHKLGKWNALAIAAVLVLVAWWWWTRRRAAAALELASQQHVRKILADGESFVDRRRSSYDPQPRKSRHPSHAAPAPASHYQQPQPQRQQQLPPNPFAGGIPQAPSYAQYLPPQHEMYGTGRVPPAVTPMPFVPVNAVPVPTPAAAVSNGSNVPVTDAMPPRKQ